MEPLLLWILLFNSYSNSCISALSSVLHHSCVIMRIALDSPDAASSIERELLLCRILAHGSDNALMKVIWSPLLCSWTPILFNIRRFLDNLWTNHGWFLRTIETCVQTFALNTYDFSSSSLGKTTMSILRLLNTRLWRSFQGTMPFGFCKKLFKVLRTHDTLVARVQKVWQTSVIGLLRIV